MASTARNPSPTVLRNGIGWYQRKNKQHASNSLRIRKRVSWGRDRACSAVGRDPRALADLYQVRRGVTRELPVVLRPTLYRLVEDGVLRLYTSAIPTSTLPSLVSTARNFNAGVVDSYLHREGVPAIINRSRRPGVTKGSAQLNQAAPPALSSRIALARTRA
jgi:hypothetical protein